MRRPIVILNFVIVWFAGVACLGAAQGKASLSGQVVDPNGALVAGADIRLRPSEGDVRLHVQTDASGHYRFDSVPTGTLILEIFAQGFRPFSRTVRLAAEAADIEEHVTLALAGPDETVLVTTATRSPMEIEKSPVSASLVTRQEMENRNIRQIDQALAFTEGVNGVRAKGPSDTDFGLGLRGFSGFGGQYRTLVLVDGQPVNNSYIGSVNWATFAVSEMDRVEVARGPFSSLYGGNAMGGVINMVTRPAGERELDVFGQYGNRDSVNYSLRAAHRFFDRLGLSFGYSRFQTGGYSPQEVLRPSASAAAGTPVTGVRRWSTATGGATYEVGEQGRNWFNQEAFRLRGEYTASPRLFVSVQYMRQSRRHGYDAYSTSLRDSSNNPIDSGTVSFLDNGVVQRLSLTPANFIGIPAEAGSSMYQTQILASLSLIWNLRIAGGINHSPSDWFVSPAANATLSSGGGSYTNTWNQGIYGNVQATRTSGRQSLILGTESRHDRARTGAQPIPNYAIREDGGPFDTQAFGKAVNHAAYVQYQKDFEEKLNVVIGGRWDYWRTYDGGSQAGTDLPLTRFAQPSTSALTGKIAAAYVFPGGWQVRGSVGNAFRNPTIYELYRDFLFVGSLLLGNPQIRSERLLAYEGGISRAFAARHSINATLFENRISDLIYRTTDPSDPTGRTRRLTNAGLGRTRGAELSAKQQVTSWLEFREFYTYTNTIITKNPGVPETVGKRMPWLPLNTVGYAVTGSRGRWTASWTGRYVSAMYSSGANLDTTRGVPGSYDPFFEMDAAVTFKVNRQWSVLANADNLLDRQHYLFYRAQGRSAFAGFRFRP